MGRHGVVTAEQVRGRFFGDVSAAYRRLRVLEKAGLVKHERVLFGEPGVYRVAGPGLQAAGVEMTPARIDLAMLRHDLAMVDLSEILLHELGGRSAGADSSAEGGVRWVTERELRSKLLASRLSEETGLIGGSGNTRTPDGVLVLGDGRRIAVELERTRKDRAKWQRILSVYIRRRDIDQVRFYFFQEWACERAEAFGRRAAEKAGMPEDFFVYLMYPGYETVEVSGDVEVETRSGSEGVTAW